MSNRLEFKGSARRLYFYLLSINGLLAIVFFISGGLIFYTTLILFVQVNVFYLLTIVSKPFKIIIDQDKSILEIHYLIDQLKKAMIISLHEIECSFNYEVLARGGKAKILKIKFGSKVLTELMSDYNGWDEKDLTLIFEKLNNVKKLG